MTSGQNNQQKQLPKSWHLRHWRALLVHMRLLCYWCAATCKRCFLATECNLTINQLITFMYLVFPHCRWHKSRRQQHVQQLSCNCMMYNVIWFHCIGMYSHKQGYLWRFNMFSYLPCPPCVACSCEYSPPSDEIMILYYVQPMYNSIT